MSTVTDYFDYPDGKRKALQPVPIEQRYASPIVARHMAEITKANEELRRWRESRKGMVIVRTEIRLRA